MTLDGSEVFNQLDSAVDDIPCSEMKPFYAQDSRQKHHFILYGHLEALNTDPFKGLSTIVSELNPDSVLIDSGTRAAHIALVFSNDRIENPPQVEAVEAYRVRPRDATSETVTECANCNRSTEPSIPPLTLRYEAETPFSTPETESHHLCTFCSIGHSDDVLRAVEWFGIKSTDTEKSEVTTVKFNESETPIPLTEIDNPYVQDFIEETIEPYFL